MQFGHETVPFSNRWSIRRMPVIVLLILANVLAFGIQKAASKAYPGFPEQYFALTWDGLQHGYLWTFVTYMFLHGGLFHLGANCFGLYFAGREVETICGPKHLLGIYFLGGILGGLAQIVLGPDAILIGASGGVCAVMLAFSTLLPELEITLLLFFVIPVRMRAKWFGRGVIILSGVLAVIGEGSVGHIAHLGGALTGWLYTRRLGYGGAFWFQRLIRERRRTRERRARMDPEQFINEEIDPILEKISREGMHSLTRTERRILELGRDKIAKKTSKG